jgi:hypothetical protein
MCLKVYKCGSRVITKLNAIEAIITGVTIRFAAVQYELSYFDNKEYKTAWLNENEFDVKDEYATQKIGFNK